jgi:hypothetical protein
MTDERTDEDIIAGTDTDTDHDDVVAELDQDESTLLLFAPELGPLCCEAAERPTRPGSEDGRKAGSGTTGGRPHEQATPPRRTVRAPRLAGSARRAGDATLDRRGARHGRGRRVARLWAGRSFLDDEARSDT